MKIKNIDLYKEFERPRTGAEQGLLTCYLPDVFPEVNCDRKYPAILIIPGGGYAFVSPREAEPIALQYAALGFVPFILNYSVSPFKYPTALIEAAMAMIYIKENGKELNIDQNKTAAVGFSAGGHLCGCLATMADDEIIMQELGTHHISARPDAVVLSYPVITSIGKSHVGSFDNLCGDNQELRRKMSLETRVSKESSPAFIWHTYNDAAVPVQNSILMASAYEAAEVDFSLHIFQNGPHGVSTADWASYHTNNLPDVSKGLKDWIKMSADWLNERGIKVED